MSPGISRKQAKIRKQIASSAAAEPPTSTKSLTDLPNEILLEIFTSSRPSDIVALLRTTSRIRDLIRKHQDTLLRDIIAYRYPVLARCFRLPASLAAISTATTPEKAKRAMTFMHGYQLSYARAKMPPVFGKLELCACAACAERWVNLVAALMIWDNVRDTVKPAPLSIEYAVASRARLQQNTAVAARALKEPLAYAWILQRRLESMSVNGTQKVLGYWRDIGREMVWGDKERLVRQIAGETDVWLAMEGRENVAVCDGPGEGILYSKAMDVSTWMPWRRWVKDESRWKYYADEAHDQEVAA